MILILWLILGAVIWKYRQPDRGTNLQKVLSSRTSASDFAFLFRA
jgi:hypothetical protein